MQNSMAVDSPEMARIQTACAEAHIHIVLGYSQRSGASIYIAQAFISSTGSLLHNRRKIKPTSVERALWGDGQADSLLCVVDTPHAKLGALNCWENFQPLLRYHEYGLGAQVHVAGWPPFPAHPGSCEVEVAYTMTASANRAISQNVAMEGQCFVLCATQIIKEENFARAGVQGKGIFKGVSGFRVLMSRRCDFVGGWAEMANVETRNTGLGWFRNDFWAGRNAVGGAAGRGRGGHSAGRYRSQDD